MYLVELSLFLEIRNCLPSLYDHDMARMVCSSSNYHATSDDVYSSCRSSKKKEEGVWRLSSVLFSDSRRREEPAVMFCCSLMKVCDYIIMCVWVTNYDECDEGRVKSSLLSTRKSLRIHTLTSDRRERSERRRVLMHVVLAAAQLLLKGQCVVCVCSGVCSQWRMAYEWHRTKWA